MNLKEIQSPTITKVKVTKHTSWFTTWQLVYHILFFSQKNQRTWFFVRFSAFFAFWPEWSVRILNNRANWSSFKINKIKRQKRFRDIAIKMQVLQLPLINRYSYSKKIYKREITYLLTVENWRNLHMFISWHIKTRAPESCMFG